MAEPSWDPPTRDHRAPGRGQHWIEIELRYPVNPWEHNGSGEISWGAHLDRLAPLGEEAVSIIREKRAQDLEEHWATRRRREEAGAKPVDLERSDGSDDQPRPGWPAHHEDGELWIHLTLYQPLNQRWEEWEGEVEYEGKKCSTSHGEMVDDGIIKRGATVEATTPLGQRAMRIMETLHSPHPYNELPDPEEDDESG
jgi:hypothetical protein